MATLEKETTQVLAIAAPTASTTISITTKDANPLSPRPTKKQRCFDSSSSSSSPLVTLRVDVHHAGNIRLVDTILFDPTCWPISSCYASVCETVSSDKNDTRIPPIVKQNAYELAHHIVSDMEVHGMGRTARHFTGRVDLYQGTNTFAPPLKGKSSSSLSNTTTTKNNASTNDANSNNPPLIEKVVQQLIPQLQHIWDNQNHHGQQQQQQQQNNNATLPPPTTSTTTTTHDDDTIDNSEKNKKEIDTSNNNNNNNNYEKQVNHNTTTNNNNLRTIQIQLSIHGIMVMDEFQWDMSLQAKNRMCPFQFAKQMTHDLNLPLDAAVPIATCIIEQLQDSIDFQPTFTTSTTSSSSSSSTNTTTTTTTPLTTTASSSSTKDTISTNTTDVTLPPVPLPLLPPSIASSMRIMSSSSSSTTAAAVTTNTPTPTTTMSAAWTIDPREHIANISSMIHQQRPPGFSGT